MKSIIMLTLLMSLLSSCRPEQAQTDFNVLIDVPIGDNVTFQTDEDTNLDFNYSINKTEDSIDLQMAIVKHPQFGKIINCSELSSLTMNCTYIPDKNFNGIDYIELTTWDGDIKADKTSQIKIEIIEVSDPPLAFDASYSTKANNVLTIEFPKGSDPDSLSSELTYQVLNNQSHGSLSNCLNRQCQYIASAYTDEVELIEYQIIDQTGEISNKATITINIANSKLTNTETFTQGVNTYEGVDIIWVVDNSGSMHDEQQALRQNFTAFIDNFLVNGKAKFPFNMAITTTDAYKLSNGNNPFREDSNGNTYDLSSTRAENDFVNFKQDFENAVLVGTRGSGDERAFESIDKAYNLNPNWFGGNNRLLTFIILSDETEHSGDTVQNWANKFFALKDKPEKVSVYPIINLSSDGDNRWSEISTLTGTSVSDITQSFQTVLDNISLNVSQNVASYQLNQSYNIVANSISVTVDGNPVSFTFQSNNTIQLTTPPAAYATIVINYEYTPGQ